MFWHTILSYFPQYDRFCFCVCPQIDYCNEGDSYYTNMVQSKRSTQAKSTTTTNQLIEAVSPFEELLPPRKNCWNASDLFPFDELIIIQPHQTRQEQVIFRTSVLETREGIPSTIAFRTSTEDASQVSVAAFSDTRTLTPHPSFEKPSITANEFHYLYQAAHKLDQEDWPSDEDGPSGGCGCFERIECGNNDNVYRKEMTVKISNDLDEMLSCQSETSCYEI